MVLLVHERPDLDAIGSQLGLYYLLKSFDIPVQMYSKDPAPRISHYLIGSDLIHSGDQGAAVVDGCDLLISLDCGSKGRLSLSSEMFEGRKLINIDHHASNRNFGDVNVVDASFCATGALIYDMICSLNLPISSACASALFAAILTDTHRFYKADAAVFRMAADLIDHGANSSLATEEIYGRVSENQLHLLQESLQTLKIRDQGCSSWITVDAAMMQRCGVDYEDTEGLIDYARNIDGIKVAVFMRHDAVDVWKVSMRGQGYNVSRIAESLGGGGHLYAAGCTMHGSQEEICAILQMKVRALLEENV